MSEYTITKTTHIKGYDIHFGKRFIRHVERRQIAMMLANELGRERFIISQEKSGLALENIKLLDEIATLKAHIGSEPTTADEFNVNMEFRHNPDEDVPTVNVQHTGAIRSIRRFTTSNRGQMAILTLDTDVEIVVFPRILSQYSRLLNYAKSVGTSLKFNCDGNQGPRNENILDNIE